MHYGMKRHCLNRLLAISRRSVYIYVFKYTESPMLSLWVYLYQTKLLYNGYFLFLSNIFRFFPLLYIYWKFWFQELQEQTEYVTYSVQTKVHNDVVVQIAYCPDNETVLSCSNDPNLTLVVRHIEGRRTPYVFKVSRVGFVTFCQTKTKKIGRS